MLVTLALMAAFTWLITQTPFGRQQRAANRTGR